jgi:hypothetical protein
MHCSKPFLPRKPNEQHCSWKCVLDRARETGRKAGYEVGYRAGYKKGHLEGYREGEAQGSKHSARVVDSNPLAKLLLDQKVWRWLLKQVHPDRHMDGEIEIASLLTKALLSMRRGE